MKALYGNLVSRLDDGALADGGSLVAIQPLLIFLLDGVAVIVKLADGNHLGERGESAHVVGVKMADEQIVDLFQAGELGCGVDAFGIAIADRPSSIDQKRFAGRGDEQRRGAAFGVNPVDVERPRVRAEIAGGNEQKREK